MSEETVTISRDSQSSAIQVMLRVARYAPPGAGMESIRVFMKENPGHVITSIEDLPGTESHIDWEIKFEPR